ncbi:hypothetical protein C8F04DRAFT_1272749 [Mycena alexandri]|uniref:Thioesterase domain-containing protein n=1 Tax=Mycena alexandri TaxID=1745969 RepID=A0AAD6S6W5_9AGAR|nr:hypothetical protein C8F04DRAFT_1272749 [Mycena alexandri]
MPFLSIPSAVEILNKPLSDALVSQIKGNAPRDVKEMTVKWLNVYHAPPKCFAGASTRRTLVTEVSLDPNPLDDNGRVLTLVTEIDVSEEILDERGKLSTGFAIAVMDECLSSAVTTLDYADGGPGVSPVSLALNTVFYNPAELGAKLRFINTTQAPVAGRMSSRCEVWDLTRRRLVATGVFLGLRSSSRL